MAEFEKTLTDVPNRLVFLKVKNAQSFALCDVEGHESFTTMGHWFPDSEDQGYLNMEVDEKPILPGKWVCVGWDWDQDEFRDCNEFAPLAWAEIP